MQSWQASRHWVREIDKLWWWGGDTLSEGQRLPKPHSCLARFDNGRMQAVEAEASHAMEGEGMVEDRNLGLSLYRVSRD